MTFLTLDAIFVGVCMYSMEIKILFINVTTPNTATVRILKILSALVLLVVNKRVFFFFLLLLDVFRAAFYSTKSISIFF